MVLWDVIGRSCSTLIKVVDSSNLLGAVGHSVETNLEASSFGRRNTELLTQRGRVHCSHKTLWISFTVTAQSRTGSLRVKTSSSFHCNKHTCPTRIGPSPQALRINDHASSHSSDTQVHSQSSVQYSHTTNIGLLTVHPSGTFAIIRSIQSHN